VKIKKSTRLRSIGLFIVLMALITSYYFNGFQSKAPSVNTKEADRFYNELTNYKKIQIVVGIKSLETLKKLIYTKLEPTGANKLHSEEQGGYALYIYQIEQQNIPAVLDNIAEIGSINSKVERISAQNTQLDLEAKLRDKEVIYQKELQDYSNSKVKYSYQLDRLNGLSMQVDSLKFEISNQKNKAMTALYIKALVAPNKVGRVQNYQKFVIDFIKYLIVFAVVISFMHYGTILLAYLFSMLGIRFPSLSSIGKGYNDYAGYKGYGGGYRGYGSYGSYGYGGSRKRRVKRIYRNKEKSDEDTSQKSEK
jgi:hypothetical protein